jgi:hypothetical protein
VARVCEVEDVVGRFNLSGAAEMGPAVDEVDGSVVGDSQNSRVGMRATWESAVLVGVVCHGCQRLYSLHWARRDCPNKLASRSGSSSSTVR